MSKVVVTKEKLVAIGDALRDKTETTEAYSLDEMPEVIQGIEAGGGADFEITNVNYLFYYGARLELYNQLVPLFKDITSTRNMFSGSDISSIDLSIMDFSKVADVSSMFSSCTSESIDLSDIHIPAGTLSNMFNGCQSRRIDLSGLEYDKSVGGQLNSGYSLSMFSGCSNLEYLRFPHMHNINRQCFYKVGSATTDGAILDLNGDFTQVGDSTSFNGTSSEPCKIAALILRPTSLVKLTSTSTFNYCWIKTETDKGFVYVPDDLVDTYKSATNWTTFASKIKPLSEYVEVTA
jgi:hypothetical protein